MAKIQRISILEHEDCSELTLCFEGDIRYSISIRRGEQSKTIAARIKGFSAQIEHDPALAEMRKESCHVAAVRSTDGRNSIIKCGYMAAGRFSTSPDDSVTTYYSEEEMIRAGWFPPFTEKGQRRWVCPACSNELGLSEHQKPTESKQEPSSERP